MRTVIVARSCLLALWACAAPALAEDLSSPPVPTLYVAPVQLSLPEAFVMAQKAETLQAIANMRARLAELVPFAPHEDAISQSAIDYAAHWGAVVENFADTQMLAVDAMILGLNEYHHDQVQEFLNAENLVPELSLFDDPVFLNMIQMPDFTNPQPTAAGFFGS